LLEFAGNFPLVRVCW